MADDQTNDAAVGDGLIADGEQKPQTQHTQPDDKSFKDAVKEYMNAGIDEPAAIEEKGDSIGGRSGYKIRAGVNPQYREGEKSDQKLDYQHPSQMMPPGMPRSTSLSPNANNFGAGLLHQSLDPSMQNNGRLMHVRGSHPHQVSDFLANDKSAPVIAATEMGGGGGHMYSSAIDLSQHSPRPPMRNQETQWNLMDQNSAASFSQYGGA